MPSRVFLDITLRTDAGRAITGKPVYIQSLGGTPSNRSDDISTIYTSSGGSTTVAQPLYTDDHGKVLQALGQSYWVTPADLQVAYQDRDLTWHSLPIELASVGGGASTFASLSDVDTSGVADHSAVEWKAASSVWRAYKPLILHSQMSNYNFPLDGTTNSRSAFDALMGEAIANKAKKVEVRATPDNAGYHLQPSNTNTTQLPANCLIDFDGYGARIANDPTAWLFGNTGRLFQNSDASNGNDNIIIRGMHVDGRADEIVMPSSTSTGSITHGSSGTKDITLASSSTPAAFQALLSTIGYPGGGTYTDIFGVSRTYGSKFPYNVMISRADGTLKERVMIASHPSTGVIRLLNPTQNDYPAGSIVSMDRVNTINSGILRFAANGTDTTNYTDFCQNCWIINPVVWDWPGLCFDLNVVDHCHIIHPSLENIWRGAFVLRKNSRWVRIVMPQIRKNGDDTFAMNSDTGTGTYPEHLYVIGGEVENEDRPDQMENSVVSIRGGQNFDIRLNRISGGHDACVSLESNGSMAASHGSVHVGTITARQAEGLTTDAFRVTCPDASSAPTDLSLSCDLAKDIQGALLRLDVNGTLTGFSFDCKRADNVGTLNNTDTTRGSAGYASGIEVVNGTFNEGSIRVGKLVNCQRRAVDVADVSTVDISGIEWDLSIQKPNRQQPGSGQLSSAVRLRRATTGFNIKHLSLRDSNAYCDYVVEFSSTVTGAQVPVIQVPPGHTAVGVLLDNGVGTIWRGGDRALGVRRPSVASNQTFTQSNTTLQNITGLAFPIAANEVWEVVCRLYLSAQSTTSDFKFGWSLPTGHTVIWNRDAAGSVAAAGSPVLENTGNTVVGSDNGTFGVVISGLITADASHSGTAQLQGSQNTSAAENNIVLAGSNVIATRVK